MPARSEPDRPRRRRNRYRTAYWVLSLAPAVIMLSIGLDVGGIREPVVDAVTGWLAERASPFPADRG